MMIISLSRHQILSVPRYLFYLLKANKYKTAAVDLSYSISEIFLRKIPQTTNYKQYKQPPGCNPKPIKRSIDNQFRMVNKNFNLII